jgi:hypothetical protein
MSSPTSVLPVRSATVRSWTVEKSRVVAFAAAAIIGGVVLQIYAPAELHLPSCVFHELTGLYCPGCGSTRALHHLFNFELLTAIHCNLMLVICLPFLAASFAMRGMRVFNLWRGPSFTLSPRNTRILTVLIFAWCIVRNLPIAWFTIPPQ